MSAEATPQVKLVAFDMGGLMIDVDESIPVNTFASMSGRGPGEVFATIFYPERKQPIETGAISPDEHARRACDDLGLRLSPGEFWQIHCTSHAPNSEVGEIVRATAGLNQITIASNLPLPHWDWAQANLPYAPAFDPPILSFELGFMKPDHGYYLELIRRSGVNGPEIFFTDDREDNMAAAASLGIRAFLFQDASKLTADLKSCGISF